MNDRIGSGPKAEVRIPTTKDDKPAVAPPSAAAVEQAATQVGAWNAKAGEAVRVIGGAAPQIANDPEGFRKQVEQMAKEWGITKLDEATVDSKLRQLHESKQLEPMIQNTLSKFGFKAEELKAKGKLLMNAIEARLDNGRLTGPRFGRTEAARANVSWEAMHKGIYAEATKNIRPGQGINADFKAKLAGLADGRWDTGNKLTSLVNGPASFAEKYKAIKEAKNSIYISNYKIYGDETGNKLADELIAKKKANPSIDIRLMVDGNVGSLELDSTPVLKRLVDAGIPVLFHHNNERPYEGFHYKDFVVDGESEHPVSINGGMNWGNAYSWAHGTAAENKADTPRWRDTDMKIEGPGARTSHYAFIERWNEAIQRPNESDPWKQNLKRIPINVNAPAVKPMAENQSTMQVVDMPNSQHNITQLYVAAIHAAKKSIKLQQAYMMQSPAIHQALIEAAKRGVEIDGLYNSPDTIDQTIVAAPNRREVKLLLEDAEKAGVGNKIRVYEKTNTRPNLHNAETLHSKFMIVDGETPEPLYVLGSYNVHGRSMRLEVEGVQATDDQKIAREISEQFKRDIAEGAAKKYTKSSELQIPFDRLDVLMHTLHLPPVNL